MQPFQVLEANGRAGVRCLLSKATGDRRTKTANRIAAVFTAASILHEMREHSPSAFAAPS